MRNPAASHHESFRQAFVHWRWPSKGQPKGSGAEVAVALEAWLAQYPEHAETIQQLSVGAAMNAVILEEWVAGRRIAGVGLNAALLGAVSSEDRLASTTLLGILAARSELGLGDALAARTAIGRTIETLQRMDAYAPLASYLQLQRHLLTAELAESSLEIGAATPSYARAVELVTAITANRRRERDLEAAWATMAFGQGPDGPESVAHALWESELRTVRRRSTLGLARTSPDQELARDAIRLCLDEGLPTADTPLALHGILSKIPRGEINDTADKLVSAAMLLADAYRDTWVTALRASQAEAWLSHGDSEAARSAIESVKPDDLRNADAIASGLAFAARARVTMATAPDESAPDDIETLLSIYAATTGQLAGTSFELRFRAACEPATTAALQAEMAAFQKQPSIDTRRQLSVLLDALRAPEVAPPRLRASSRSAAQRAVRHATDRLGRLAAAVANRGEATETLVLVIQSVGDVTTFICVGGDVKDPIAITSPDARAHQALRSLTAAAERAVSGSADDIELEAVGRSTFDALPTEVRARMLRARTLVVVPDVASAQDRVPIELLHDGENFFGIAKVVVRCLSLSHALRAIEAPLVSPVAGRRALCVSVATPPGFPALRFADEETVAVIRVLSGALWLATPVRDATADARTILELAPLANVLHIACHGEASAGAEALVLGDGVRLSAAEIATRHRLRGVIYLNACSLAQGRYLGGGVSRGVAYAFVKAGAPCVIANLLPVEDQGAALLSEAFYHAAREYPVGEAMRRARAQLSGQMNAALLTASVVIGDPFAKIGGDSEARSDATSRLLRDVVAPARITSARAPLDETSADPRLAAAIDFARALRMKGADLEMLARVARDIGHEIGEAHCRSVLAERRGLDPGFKPRTLRSVHMASGLSVNDRSVPAVDAVLSFFEAQQQHESHWRGEPVLRVPDLDAASIAHNAVVWGYLNRVNGTGAEVGLASAFAARAAWRGLVAEEAVPNLQRILAGLLRFLWGKQKVQHLEHWMASAQRDVIVLAIDRVIQYWTAPGQSPAQNAAREIAAAIDGAFMAPSGGSKFAQARAALRATEAVTPSPDALKALIEAAIRRLHAVDPYAAADLGAWILGDLLTRANAATMGPVVKREVALVCTSLCDAFEWSQEGWFMPYLMDGFKSVRESGGQDVFAQWSADMV